MDIDDEIERMQLLNILNYHLNGLTPREKYCIEHRYCMNGYDFMTYDEIGTYFGVSATRSRTITNKAIVKLQDKLIRKNSKAIEFLFVNEKEQEMINRGDARKVFFKRYSDNYIKPQIDKYIPNINAQKKMY